MAPPTWHADASCKEHPEADYFPDRKDRTGTEEALAVCGSCLVRSECLAEAMADPDLVGVWGGTTEDQRRGLRRAQVA